MLLTDFLVPLPTPCKYAGVPVPIHPRHRAGWYHSHPGYGCWLSGIDVSTQSTHQAHEDPYLAIVVDPVRTMAAGKVEIGAFRTYPPDYKPPDAVASEYQSIPLDKIEDFGVHANQYYPLDISFFKSSLDSHLLALLWNKYWISTLSSSPLIANRDYTIKSIKDLSEKIDQAEQHLNHNNRSVCLVGTSTLADISDDLLAYRALCIHNTVKLPALFCICISW
jgi:COP9 signalosome complex subunit 5